MAHPSIESSSASIPRPRRRVLRGLVDVVFPARCPVCGAPSDPGSDLACKECLGLLEQGRLERACPRCAVCVAPYEVHEGRCKTCRRRRLFTAGIVRVAAYTTPCSTAWACRLSACTDNSNLAPNGPLWPDASKTRTCALMEAPSRRERRRFSAA